MKKNSTLALQFFILLFSGLVLLASRCSQKPPDPANPPTGPLSPITVTLPRPDEQKEPDELKNIDFFNGPCRDIFDPSKYTVSIGVYYLDGLGQEVQFGNIQDIYNVTIPASGDITLPNVMVPSGGEYWIKVFYAMDNCTQCCSKAYLQSNGILEGCDATLQTQLIEQGKPRFEFISEVIRSVPNPITGIPLNFRNFYCYCNCY